MRNNGAEASGDGRLELNTIKANIDKDTTCLLYTSRRYRRAAASLRL